MALGLTGSCPSSGVLGLRPDALSAPRFLPHGALPFALQLVLHLEGS